MATICVSCRKKIDDLVDLDGDDYGDVCEDCANEPGPNEWLDESEVAKESEE